MLIGIPKEVKNHEYRVGANPELVHVLTRAGHQVVIETNAGKALGYTDEIYANAGAKIVPTAKEAWTADMVIKVKEPQPSEFSLMHENQILFCFLHLSPEPKLTQALIDKKVIAIAWETVTDNRGNLPILVPMSEIAGRISIQAGATALQLSHGGKGLLMGGVPGVQPAIVVIIGGGIVGLNAARMAQGLGAHVTILDTNIERLRMIDNTFNSQLRTVFSTEMAIEKVIQTADLIIGSVLIPGKLAPKVLTKHMLKKIQPRSVLVDVAIDQGGCFESSKPTSHAEPTYIEEDIVHYCVTNMPGACAKTATRALMNVITKYALELANFGYQEAFRRDKGLLDGLNIYKGHVTNQHVATDLGYEYRPFPTLF